MNIGIDATLPIAAGVMAACSYGLQPTIPKQRRIDSFENAHGKYVGSGALILPSSLFCTYARRVFYQGNGRYWC